LKQRERLDDAAFRRIDKFRSDCSKKVSSDTMNMMLDSQQNPVRDQSWSAQMKHFQLDVASRTLRAAFNQRRSRVSRFKKAIIRPISNKNKLLRKQYAETHKMHTVVDFWQYVHFTNEAHFDSNQMFQKQTLREEDIKYEKKNMQTMSNMKRIKLHVVVSISWHHKGTLQFYNDEHDMSDIQIKKSRKSRKRKHETENEYRQRVVEWETSLSHDVKIKLKNNSMTQGYYTKRLLLIYAKEIPECRVFHDRACIFQIEQRGRIETCCTDASWSELSEQRSCFDKIRHERQKLQAISIF
jgi:hypothetical protein